MLSNIIDCLPLNSLSALRILSKVQVTLEIRIEHSIQNGGNIFQMPQRPK
jgi:hypothetical protein